jgi:hypothetical protein
VVAKAFQVLVTHRQNPMNPRRNRELGRLAA